MIKRCLVCGSLKDFGGNVNATTCPDCLRTGHKYCSWCHTIKSLDQFGKAGKNALGEVRYTGECKGCLKLRQAQYYAKNKEHIKLPQMRIGEPIYLSMLSIPIGTRRSILRRERAKLAWPLRLIGQHRTVPW